MIHARFSTAGAKTLRFSSSEPNFQNLSKELRTPFVSRWREGGWIAHADMSGLEPRIIADRTNCKYLMDIFKPPTTSRKVYLIAGRDIIGREIKKPSRDYDLAKEVILATNYNAMVWTLLNALLLRGIEVSYDEGEEFVERYFDKAPELREYINEQGKLVERDKRIRCMTGYVREYPHEGREEYGFKHVWNQAVNLEIQHVASVIAAIWMNLIQRRIRWERLSTRDLRPHHTALMGPVHDSVTHDARTREIAERLLVLYQDALVEVQEEVMVKLIGRKLRVPLEQDSKIVSSWDQAK